MKILVAESQKAMRHVMLSFLEKNPHTILKTNDLTNIETLLQYEEPDLLILDFDLIKTKSSDFTYQLISKYPQLKIILTLYPEDSADLELIPQSRNISPILKPFSEEQFETLIQNFLSERKNPESEKTENKYCDLRSLPSAEAHPAMKKAIGYLNHIADSDITVMILGESGVGKEMFAQTLHQLSRRRNQPFVGINCASIPATLLESELFGYEKGSFTGALTKHIGKFELAQKGTLLLDEVSEMDPLLQAKLLRVIQEKELYRVGGHQKIQLDVRLIATTNRDLKESVRNRQFREDLFYRLNVISVRIPPLRERIEDVSILAKHILNRLNLQNINREMTLSSAAIQQLSRYSWPGNVRELENIITRTAYLTHGDTIDHIWFDDTELESPPLTVAPREAAPEELPMTSIKEIERQMIYRALEIHKGNRVRASQSLGISVRTLRNKLKAYREEGLVLPAGITLPEEGDFEDEKQFSILP